MTERPQKKSLSGEEINKLPLYRLQAPVRLVRTDVEVRRMRSRLKGEKILGFDTETKPSFRKGEKYLPSLVQLAGAREVFVVQLRRLKDLGWFRDILGNPRIIKAGVSLSFDVKQLQEIHPFEARGMVELAQLADEAGVSHNGLRGMAAAVLGYRISKAAQRSDWSRLQLSRKQVLYAATDAWVCRELFVALGDLRQQRDNG